MLSKNSLLPLLVIGVIAFFLRASFLADVPSSPYWEETILGYDAYSLSETGRDHHNISWPLLAVESFGDWKPTGYIYAAMPFVKLFGLELWVVRLPSLLAGLMIVIAVAVLASRIRVPAWMGAFVVALSPWGIHFSRGAWEAHLATALIAWAMIFSISAVKKEKLNLLQTLLSVGFFVFAWYTYHAARLVVPLLGLGVLMYALVTIQNFASQQKMHFATYVKKYLYQSRFTLFLTLVLICVSLQPILTASSSQALGQRFNEVGIFSDSSAVLKSNKYRELLDNSLIARVLYHRYVFWSESLLTAYLDNLNPNFLFLNGESNLRHTTGDFGLFYVFESVFILVGLLVWIKRRKPVHWLLIYWLAVSLIPSALSFPTPHALRILIGLPVFLLLIAQGLHSTSSWLILRYTNQSKSHFLKQFGSTIVFSTICLLYAISLSLFWFNYTQMYPIVAARQWQDGYKEMYEKLQLVEAANPTLPVYISRSEGRPAAFLWFYRQIDPKVVQQVNTTALKDQGEFLEFQNYHFVRSAGEIPDERALVVLTEKEFIEYQTTKQARLLDTVISKNGETVWTISQQ